MSKVYFRVQLTDEMLADTILDAARAAARDGNLTLAMNAVVASAVRIGRQLGKQEGAPPLDDGIRGTAAAARDELTHKGLHGLTNSLARLNRWLEAYPVRGLPDVAYDEQAAGEFPGERMASEPDEPPPSKRAAEAYQSANPSDRTIADIPKGDWKGPPPFDITKPIDLENDVALGLMVLDNYQRGDGPFTQGDARRLVATIRELWDMYARELNKPPFAATGEVL